VHKRQINPWTWQDQFGFSQCWRVDSPSAVLFLAGQGPASADGELVGAGDFEAQARQVFANLATVLEQAGASLESVVRLVVYLTDMANLRAYERIVSELIPGPKPVGTAIGVRSLAVEEMLIEIEATAVV
jgi:enamine deaminase RidA (YjgF/YER057c/UK114 family)